MRPIAAVAAGATFVGSVVAGFALGLVAARQTGASWWAIVGVFGGLVAGAVGVATQLRQAVR